MPRFIISGGADQNRISHPAVRNGKVINCANSLVSVALPTTRTSISCSRTCNATSRSAESCFSLGLRGDSSSRSLRFSLRSSSVARLACAILSSRAPISAPCSIANLRLVTSSHIPKPNSPATPAITAYRDMRFTKAVKCNSPAILIWLGSPTFLSRCPEILIHESVANSPTNPNTTKDAKINVTTSSQIIFRSADLTAWDGKDYPHGFWEQISGNWFALICVLSAMISFFCVIISLIREHLRR